MARKQEPCTTIPSLIPKPPESKLNNTLSADHYDVNNSRLWHCKKQEHWIEWSITYT